MKKLIPVVILFMCFSHGFGQTTIDSDIVTNTVWTKASSPFLVNSPVTVLENITLTIEPGVVIKNNHNSDILRVNGTVIAEGTAGDPIVFTFISDDVYGGDSNNDGGATVPEAGNWGSIEVRATSSNTTRFQHCIFRFGGRLQGALFADNSSPQVSDCLFQNCKYGFETNGTVSPSVLNNQFEGITMLPVIISLGSTPVFSGNSFNNNALIALGLKKNNHGLNGDAYTLKKINLAGIDNIPYVIEYRIDIPENTTLTIEPGVVLKNYNILDLVRVYGTIIAEGTTTEPIVFTFISDDEFGGDSNNDGDASAPEAGDWESIEVMEASSNTSRFQHCLFRFGGRIDGVLFADNSSPQTTNCLFQNCKYGFETNGMVSPPVQDNQFEGTTMLPVLISPGSTPVFSGNSFKDNALTGLGLRNNNHAMTGDAYTLKKTDLAGINNIPYVVEYRIDIPENSTLTIEPGVVLKNYNFLDLMRVYGTLIAEGTTAEPIVFTFISDDEYGGDSNNDGYGSVPKAGVWESIEVKATSGNTSRFQHCIFRYGGRLEGALFADNSYPSISHSKYEDCKTGLEISNQTGLVLNNLEFSQSQTGLAIHAVNGIVLVDSSRFFQNNDAIIISAGNATINHSEFFENTQFDISNTTQNPIDATNNWWGNETFMEMIAFGNPKNLRKFYDYFDSEIYGIIDYSGFLIPSSDIFIVSPGSGLQLKDTGSVTIAAYPVFPDTKVLFYNESTGAWLPESTTYIDSMHIRSFWDYSKAEIGLYNVFLINGIDSLKMIDGFALVKSETPFGEWVGFEVSNEKKYTSGVLLPQGERIYCLVKKAARTGYSSTWKGNIGISGEEGNIVKKEESSYEDLELLLKNVSAGYYTFNISSNINDFWEGSIKFCIDPDTLILDEWSTGKVLRSYGNDWKVFELKNSVNELVIQTEGFGKNSSVNVYYDFLGNMDQHWFFKDSKTGYLIKGAIPDPPTGKYYVKYKDSAVLQEGDVRSNDQSRDYLIYTGTNGIQQLPEQAISVLSLSSVIFGQNYSTLIITGKGLSENTFVQLYNEKDTIFPVKLVYNEELSELYVDLDFSLADTGTFVLNLRNNLSDYTHPTIITVEVDLRKPVGIQIIGSDKYRVGRHQTVVVKITNHSNSNIKNGYVSVAFDSENLSMSIEEALYSPEMNDSLNMLYEKHNILSQYFFFSNLPPHEELYIKMKMFSDDVNDQRPIILEVKSGILKDDTYDVIFSLFTNTVKELINSAPFRQSFKDSINAMTPAQWDEVNDLMADYFGLNHFQYNENNPIKKSSLIINKQVQSDANSAERQHNKATTFMNWWLGGTSLLTADYLGLEIVSSAFTGLLPAGLSAVFGGPTAVLETGMEAVLSLVEKCTQAIAGIGGAPEEESSELMELLRSNSWTPEDKYGPVGASVAVNDTMSNHFIDSLEVFEYRIDYWNKEDATAPAALVYIRDTLDMYFNVSSFKFTEIGFLKWTAPLEGGQYFNIDVDTRPDMPYIVNIEGTIDPDSREVYWVHTTLDPETMALTEDPLGGYLPPIDSTWYQLGWVSYTIESEKNLPDSTRFTNQAFVNFDGVGKWGPAPKEGPFTNIFDFSTPVSKILEGTTQSYIDSVLISWSGTDAGSGIQDFTVYVSDGGEFVSWRTNIADTTSWFHGEMGQTYHFCSIARDRVGNVEQKNKETEHSVYFVGTNISQSGDDNTLFSVYPNPSKGQFTLEDMFSSDPVKVEIFNSIGKRVYSNEMREHKMLVDLSDEPDGIYILFVNSTRSVFSKKIIISKGY